MQFSCLWYLNDQKSHQSELQFTKSLTLWADLSIFLEWLVTYHHLSFVFSILDFCQSCSGKIMIFGDQINIHQTNWNHRPIYNFLSNFNIVQSSMCTEAEKCGFSWTTDLILLDTFILLIPSSIKLSNQKNSWPQILPTPIFPPFCWYYLQFQFILFSERTFSCNTETLESVWILSKSSWDLLKLMDHLMLSWNSSFHHS